MNEKQRAPLIALALVPLLLLSMETEVVAQTIEKTCTDASFQGLYRAHFSGTDIISGGPIVAIAEIDADGEGIIDGAFVANFNGNVDIGTFAGTYSVGNDCAGSLNFLGSTLSLVVTADGDELFLVQVAPATSVVLGIIKRL